MNSDYQGLGLRAVMARLASNSAVYGLAGILNRFSSLLLLPFFTAALTTSDYGVLSLIALVTTAAIGVFNLGTANSIGFLYFSKTGYRYHCQVIWTGAIFLALNCAGFLMLLWWSFPYLSDAVFGTDANAPLIQLAIFGMICSVIADPFLAHLRMNNKAVAYVALTLLSFIATSGLSVWFVLFQKVGVVGILQAQVCGQALLLALSLFLVGRKLIFTFDWRLVRPLVAIGFPSVIGSFATLLLTYSDRWLIEYFLGLGQLGVYSVGLSFGMFIAVLVGAFDTAWPPFFSSYLNRREEAKRVFSLVFTYFVFGFGIVALAIFTVAKPVVSLLTAEPFHEAWMVVGFVGLSQVLYGSFSILGTGIYFSRKLGYISLFKWIAAAINIGLNIILIPLFGITGAALSMLFGYLSLVIMTHFVSRIELPIDYEWQRISKYVSLFILSIMLHWFFNKTFDVMIGLVLSTSIFALFVVYLWKRILSCEERHFIASLNYNLRYK